MRIVVKRMAGMIAVGVAAGACGLQLASHPAQADSSASTRTVSVPSNTVARLACEGDGIEVHRRGKKLTDISFGMALRPGDVVKNTGSDSVNIHIGDQAVIRLRPHTTIHLNMIEAHNSEDDTENTRVGLDEGAIMVRLRHLRGQSRFAVEAPGAITAAHGTIFMVDMSDGGQPTTAVAQGEVGVALSSQPTQEVNVDARQQLTVSHGVLPRRPIAVTARFRAFARELRFMPQPGPWTPRVQAMYRNQFARIRAWRAQHPYAVRRGYGQTGMVRRMGTYSQTRVRPYPTRAETGVGAYPTRAQLRTRAYPIRSQGGRPLRRRIP